MQQSLFSTLENPSKHENVTLKDKLNESQYQAVTHTNGPVLVIAGAGSGKTRTLVYRTAHLVKMQVPPERILLLTFTRKAALEMVQRASLIIDDSCQRVMGGTFHAVASIFLRRYGHVLGYKPNFTIIDQSDAEGIVNLLKSSLNFSGLGKKFPSKRLVVSVMSRAVNKSLSLEDLIEDKYWHLQEFTEELLTIREHYKNFKFEHGLMDYDDLLVNWKRILQESPSTLEDISSRFKHVMVDEYQDTNHIQADIIRLIGRGHNNVMVVGDDSQSIYSFRGADFKNIMDFPQLFKDVRIIRLEENYRSTQPILTMTNAIIDRAVEKYSKKLFSRVEGGGKPVLYGAKNEADQAHYIVKKILQYHEKGEELGTMAVLFRSGFHSYKLELELANKQLSFEKRGGLKLTESAHIKDVISYLRVISNPKDHLSWNRILLHIQKVGPMTAQKILEFIKSEADPFASLRLYKPGNAWRHGFEELISFFDKVLPNSLSPADQFDLVMQYYKSIFERIFHDDYPTRARDLEQLRTILSGYADLQSFIDDTALDPPENLLETRGSIHPESDQLILSTVHSAKGLEWDTVFIINLVEGKFPSSMARQPEEIEEERRLLYVAATRAKKRLFLLYPREVLGPERYTEPAIISRYLEELPTTVTEVSATRREEHFFQDSKYHSAPSGRTTKIAGSEITVDSRIKHSFFGEGRVVKMEGTRTVSIFFPRHGTKTIHLDYAKVEILS